jgi:16S rRNA G966 N2-methylase RsmD
VNLCSHSFKFSKKLFLVCPLPALEKEKRRASGFPILRKIYVVYDMSTWLLVLIYPNQQATTMPSLPSLRGFLVTGLPLHDDSTMFMTNRQLARLVQEVMSNHLQMKIEDLSEFTAPADSVGINEETHQPPKRRQNSFQIYFDRNIHRRIKHGAFTLVFPSHRVSSLFWMRVISSFPVVNRLENDCAEAQSYRIPSLTLNYRGQITVLDQLQISYSAGKVRDHFHPALDWRQRSALEFDGTAVYSSTNVPTALRQAYLINLLIRNLCPQEPRSISVLDAFACCGGATLGFLALAPSLCQVDITAVELDKGRAEMLRHNIELIHGQTNNVRVVVEGRSTNGFADPQHRVRIHLSCTFEYLAQRYAALVEAATVQSAESNHFDVILLDPPWGGPQYNAEQRAPHQQSIDANGQDSENMDPFPSFEVSGATAMSLRNGEIQSESSTVETISFSELVRSLVVGSWSRLGSIIVMKVPACSETWYSALAQECVGDQYCSSHQSRERVFPLAFYFGAHTRLVCFIQNRHFCRGTGIMSNSDLDSLIHDIMTKLHHGSDPSYMGHCSMTISPREHRSRFYDYEKNRWIDLKKWKGSKELNGQ